jgi:predicted RNA-binding protein with RPS1 domain
VHVSRMGAGYTKHPSDAVKIGDKVKVHVAEIDNMGRINLSMQFDQGGRPMVMPKPERRNSSFNQRSRFARPDRRRSSFERNRPRRPRY